MTTLLSLFYLRFYEKKKKNPILNPISHTQRRNESVGTLSGAASVKLSHNSLKGLTSLSLQCRPIGAFSWV